LYEYGREKYECYRYLQQDLLGRILFEGEPFLESFINKADELPDCAHGQALYKKPEQVPVPGKIGQNHSAEARDHQRENHYEYVRGVFCRNALAHIISLNKLTNETGAGQIIFAKAEESDRELVLALGRMLKAAKLPCLVSYS